MSTEGIPSFLYPLRSVSVCVGGALGGLWDVVLSQEVGAVRGAVYPYCEYPFSQCPHVLKSPYSRVPSLECPFTGVPLTASYAALLAIPPYCGVPLL